MLSRSENLKTELGAESLRQQIIILEVLATISELIRKDLWGEQNLNSISLDIQLAEYRKMIYMFPQKVTRVHQRLPVYNVRHKWFGAWCIDNLSQDQNFLRSIVFSDECLFRVSGIAILESYFIWGSDNPILYRRHDMYRVFKKIADFEAPTLSTWEVSR